jgi:hypothetical protein
MAAGQRALFSAGSQAEQGAACLEAAELEPAGAGSGEPVGALQAHVHHDVGAFCVRVQRLAVGLVSQRAGNAQRSVVVVPRRGDSRPCLQRPEGQREHRAAHLLAVTVERSYSKGPILNYAAIRNQAGNYTIPSTASITADASQKPHITPADFSIVHEPGPSSYPISGYSWALIFTHQTSQATGKALVSLVDWLTHSGQAYAAATSYVPLPPSIQQLASTMLQQITGPNGTRLLG